MSNDLAIQNSAMDLVMSANIEQVSQQLQAIDNFQVVVQKTLRPEQDYGTIPGTNKPTLLKPGAEKILMLMGLTSEYEIVDKVEDYTNGFFAYTVKSSLLKNGQLITEGFGSANTKESRYRPTEWSESERKKVWTGDYQDPYTLVNTVLKMAKKRAQVDAALTVGSLSNVFTQDVEDMKDLLNKEKLETMNNSDASALKVTFGKNKGRTLGEIAKDDRSYVEWLSKNAKDESMKQAARLVLNTNDKSTVVDEQNKNNKVASPDQIAEIELMIEVVSQALETSKDDLLMKYKANMYKKFTEDQAKRFLTLLKNQMPKEEPKQESKQEALFDTYQPHAAIQGDPFEGEVPFPEVEY
jgi:hypothetical protein